MTLRPLPCTLILLVSLFSVSSSAQRKVPPAYSAEVVSEEAYFFSAPSLEARVLALLPPGTKVLASTKIYGDMAKFRRVKFQGKIGYISTIDVTRPDGSRPRAAGTPPKREYKDESPGENLFREPEFPSIFRDGIGVVASYIPGRVNLISPRTLEMWAVGLKLAGPDWFWKGPIADFQVSLAVPSKADPVLKDLSAYSVLADYGLMFPFFLREKFNFTVRVGPSVIYNSVESAQQGFRLKRWDIGLSLAPTLSYSFGALRLDSGVKYHWNGAPFWTYFLSFEYLTKANSPH